MQQLNGNARYGLPPDGPCWKLDKFEPVRVTLRGLYKGHIRVGKRAFACIFLRDANWLKHPGRPVTYYYVNKGAFIDLICWLDARWSLGLESFYVEYTNAGLEFFHESEVEYRRRVREQTLALLKAEAQEIRA